MKKVIRAFAAWLYQYGIENARKPSLRGSYEADVPVCLKK